MYRLRVSDEPGVFYMVDGGGGRDVGELAWNAAGALEVSWYNGERWMRIGESASMSSNPELSAVGRLRDILASDDGGNRWMRAAASIAGFGTEPTNEDRAAWAADALERYAQVTRHSSDDRDLEENLGDLLGDLMHLARLEGETDDLFDSALSAGRNHFDEELAEEAEMYAQDGAAQIDESRAAATLPAESADRVLYDFGDLSDLLPNRPGREHLGL